METDIARAQANVAARLHTRGVDIAEGDSPDDAVRILEAVEDFECAVEAAGGDLMVDEPPLDHRAQPDDERFALPIRGPREPAELYIDRLTRATEIVRDNR
jgi:hypothetical protein